MIEKRFSTISISENTPMLKVEFTDKKYEVLSTLFFADGSTICSLVIEKFEEIKNGKIPSWVATGNVCSIDMTSENTSVYDIFDDDNHCTLCTDDFIELIYEWNKEVAKFNEIL